MMHYYEYFSMSSTDKPSTCSKTVNSVHFHVGVASKLFSEKFSTQ